MTALIGLSGKCLCGVVRFRARAKTLDVAACHCSMCRRWTGGPFLCLELAEPAEFEGEAHVGVYRSSGWGERGFCRECGTTLFWRMQGGGHYAISAGALDSAEGLNFTHQIFIDEKPAFYEFANETAKMTGAEVEAAFAGGGDG
jgi:hypothetical protein